MKTLLAIIGALFVVFVLTMFAVCNDDPDDPNGWARVQVASHEYEGDCDWSGDCGDDSYRNDYSSRDRHRNERRNRGAFSPGPFDRSPVTIIICPPGTPYCGSDGGQNDQPPEEEA